MRLIRYSRPSPSGDKTQRVFNSPRWLRNPWLILLAAIGCVLVAVQFRGFAFPGRQPAPGPRLSALRLQGLTGGPAAVSLSDLKGRVAVLHLWSPNNALCRMQLSYIADLQHQLRSNSDVTILPVCYGKHPGEDLAVLYYETRLFLQQANINMLCYVDPDGTTRKAATQAVGTEELPLTLVLDRQGFVRRYFIGFRPGDHEQLRQLLLQLASQ